MLWSSRVVSWLWNHQVALHGSAWQHRIFQERMEPVCFQFGNDHEEGEDLSYQQTCFKFAKKSHALLYLRYLETIPLKSWSCLNFNGILQNSKVKLSSITEYTFQKLPCLVDQEHPRYWKPELGGQQWTEALRLWTELLCFHFSDITPTVTPRVVMVVVVDPFWVVV